MRGSLATGSGHSSFQPVSFLRLRKLSMCALRATWYIQAVNEVLSW